LADLPRSLDYQCAVRHQLCRADRLALQPDTCNAGRLAQVSFRLVPVRSPLLGESQLIFFPEGTEMFQFPSFATPGLCIQLGISSTFLDVGFPIRRSTGRRLLTAHRRLSQFCHVLLRLLVPRHPPNALTSLTTRILCTPQRSRLPARASKRSGSWPSHSLFVRLVSTQHIPDARRARARLTSHAKSTSCRARGALAPRALLRARTSFNYSLVNRRAIRTGWARQDLNLRPRAYQARALTS
jgi:hypothetical protein